MPMPIPVDETPVLTFELLDGTQLNNLPVELPEWLYAYDAANLDTAVAFRRNPDDGIYEYHSIVRLMPLLWEGDQN